MKRYIVPIEVAQMLNIETKRAIDELGQAKVITDEALHFDTAPFASIMLNEEKAEELRQQGYEIREELPVGNVTLGADYERVRSFHFKTKLMGFTGKGAKVAVLDTGCNNFPAFGVNPVPVDFEANFADANPGILDQHGHGTRVASTIKAPGFGIAPDCILHFVKTLTDGGFLFESAAVAAFDYCVDQEIDFINLSWTFWTPAVQAAIEACQAAGIVVCAASGNTGGTEDVMTLLPASLQGVVAVNACPENGEPYYRNVIPNNMLPNTHGITVACSGVAAEGYNRAGGYSGGWGTSFACPFFVGTLAVYKEMLQESDNNKVLEYALRRAVKKSQTIHFGAGLASF
jgi:minor extracellular protease Epr